MVILTVFGAILGGLAGVALAGLSGLDLLSMAIAYPAGGTMTATAVVGLRLALPGPDGKAGTPRK